MCLTNLAEPSYLHVPTGKPFVFGYDYTHFFYALSPATPYVESKASLTEAVAESGV